MLAVEDASLVAGALGDQVGIRAAVDEPFRPGTVTVLHRRGVVDDENTSDPVDVRVGWLVHVAEQVAGTVRGRAQTVDPIQLEACELLAGLGGHVRVEQGHAQPGRAARSGHYAVRAGDD